ncbi:Gfo/Idh/MocA family oxidoreductase [Fulvivirgaceae bacterium BMA12]|uniref:Gfo/Idh/MocA family oxidoreductase n=1 Tax=Agaribacillus aureus TaxID=3051825 RepID=A0ABT8LH19_9BACT|nr:Gfo/Idh/MocA family oxidoreductase [Fulvivirgaceae bacterium BMA12]
MRKINWGIISTGTIAHSFALDFKHVQEGNLIAVASRSMDKAREFANQYDIDTAYSSYEALYNDPRIEAVYIATPHNFHLKNASDALRAGKAVLCEKPLTVSPGECKQLIQLANLTGNYLMEAMWTYFLPPILKAQEWVKSGLIGAIKHIKADFGYAVPFDACGRMYNPGLAGGALLDMGIYPIAAAWLFYRKDPLSWHVIARKATTGVDNDVVMLLRYEDEVASLTTSFRSKLPNYLYIIGTKGYIQIPDFWRARECLLYLGEECTRHYIDPRTSAGFNFEIDAVNRDILHGRKESGIMPHAYSLKFQEMMEQVRGFF